MGYTMTSTTPYLKPVPVPSDENRSFWDGMRQHEFRVPRCTDCGRYSWVPYPACRNCLSENQEWTRVSGDATVYTYTVVHRGPAQFNAEVPYIIVAAALVEEPTHCVVLSNTTGIAPEDIYIGMPIQVSFEDVPEQDVTLWRFAPRE